MKTVIRPETEMKDSGDVYIGKMPLNWRLASYKYFADSGMGLTILKEDVTDLGVPIYSATQDSSIFGYINNPKLKLNKGDLVIPARGNSIGCTTYVEDDIATCTQTTIYSKVSGINPKFLFYCSIGLKEEWFYYVKTAIPQITVSQVQNNKVPLPLLSEQQAIADYLDETCSKIDEIIAEAKASIDEYKELRESVISNATTRGIKKNRSMKSSGVEWLPEIPADWNVLSPKVVFTQRKDRAIKGERQLTASQKHGIMYQDDYMKEEGVRIVTVEKDFSILKHVEPDDFVISMRSFQGGLEYSYLRGCISSAYVMLIPNHKYVYSEYYKWFFKSDKYINALQSTSDLIRDGQALRYANFVKLKLFDIPIEEQKEIADYLNKEVPKIDSLITEKESLINDLEAYKKSLIYEVVTGKRRVV